MKLLFLENLKYKIVQNIKKLLNTCRSMKYCGTVIRQKDHEYLWRSVTNVRDTIFCELTHLINISKLSKISVSLKFLYWRISFIKFWSHVILLWLKWFPYKLWTMLILWEKNWRLLDLSEGNVLRKPWIWDQYSTVLGASDDNSI